MSKRGGGSTKGGAASPNRSDFYGNSATAGHISDRYNANNDERAVYLQQALGLNEDEAYKMAEAFEDFTGGEYREIRKALYDENTSHSGYNKGQLLEEYISMSPKYYNKGAIYRGVKLDASYAQELVNTLSNGGMIDMRGPASWSSSISTANNFASNPFGASIVFKLPNGTKAGASIRHLSEYFGEDEVLVSTKTQYKASKIVQTGNGRWEIDLVETLAK